MAFVSPGKLTFLSFSWAVVSMACSSAEPPPTYYRDIQPLVTTHCVDCHAAGGIAPFALDTYEALKAHLQPAVMAINARTMPPWGAEPGHENYLYDISLSDAQIARFNQWADTDAPLGDPDDARAPEALDKGGLNRVDVELVMPESYDPDVTKPDDYRCFGIDWPETEAVYVNGFSATPGNARSVHHIVAFLVGPEQAQVIDGFDAASDGPGYGCYGGATMDGWSPKSLAETLSYSFLGQWAPGQLGTTFPAGTGLLVKPGSKVVLQMHYNTLADGDLVDTSAVQFSHVKDAQRSYYVPWFDMTWYTNSESMRIPSGMEEVQHAFQARIDTAPALGVLTDGEKFERGARISAVFPHMHQLGQRITIRRIRREVPTTLLNVPEWDFNWQREYHFAEATNVFPSDELQIECTWSNTEKMRGQRGVEPITPVDVGWGEGTTDEMCIAMVYLTPL